MKNITRILLVFATLGMKVPVTAAEPYVLSTEVQQFALEIGLSEELGINWPEASADNIAAYINTLTAIDIVAQRIAVANKRAEPSFDDYIAASASMCRLICRINLRKLLNSETLLRVLLLRSTNRNL